MTNPSTLPDFDHPPGTDLWVFAYGSLMWNPGFPFVEKREGLLRGYHRGFCIYSHQHRGTPERPGAVLGLDRGGACRGMVFRVEAAAVPDVLRYLWQREMAYRVYIPRRLRVRTDQGDVRALTFTADPAHSQYCGRLGLDGTASLIRQGVGQSGRNVDYLSSLIDHLAELGIEDQGLRELAARI
ncbi:gamma-glutamylcyclotransferase [Niveispirillum lacus]|uniref:glutathione-specific gamma-glutamylcyclotransferase n=1 Tax=Niveispirillum lacus TaxID=1981099 RepID=A0A255Z1N1_9PROT|nr:gamma-glutamylcyclotransferase [Niveispirillum lacus]OYQ35362.1 gamma-glutamylcyclotransferase [Niveispirillum lacus]